jgi:polysaccharide biosynthesis protein PslH
MDILFLSHCTPNPPDKGEKIRAFHEVTHLAARHRVHLVCFARNQAEMEAARQLSDCCASVYVERLRPGRALSGAVLQFAGGRSVTVSFYSSKRIRECVDSLARRVQLSATLAYSSAMASYAPAEVPLLLDMVDVDSEKWLDYARARHPGFPYRWEGSRLRRLEAQFARRARCTFVSTHQEESLLRGFAGGALLRVLKNGVDFGYFDPYCCPLLPQLRGRKFLVFIGVMNYYPNADAARWFATEIFPELRRKDPSLELLLVGRDPAPSVRKLTRISGVTVTGTVDDVRPYLAGAQAVVAPLRIARGIQNKVLEALAMGKRVFASTAASRTFAPDLPDAVVPCDSAEDFISAIGASGRATASEELEIRTQARGQFAWARNLEVLSQEIEQLAEPVLTNAQ